MSRERKVSPDEFCKAFYAWADACMTPLATDHEATAEWRKQFAEHWSFLRLAITKSCLLDRLIYVGEPLRTRPCPVHQGRWSGIQWPDDAQCECARGRSCGCTTGWLPEPLIPADAPTTPAGSPEGGR